MGLCFCCCRPPKIGHELAQRAGIDESFEERFDVLLQMQTNWARFDAGDDQIRAALVTPINVFRLMNTALDLGAQNMQEDIVDMTRWSYEAESKATAEFRGIRSNGYINVVLNDYKAHHTLMTVTIETVEMDIVLKCIVEVRKGQAMMEIVMAMKLKVEMPFSSVLNTSMFAKQYTTPVLAKLNFALAHLKVDGDYGAAPAYGEAEYAPNGTTV